MPFLALVSALLLAVLAVGPQVARAQDAPAPEVPFADEACLKCHGDEKIDSLPPEELAAMVRSGAPPRAERPSRSLFIRPESLSGTPHVELRCLDCHASVRTLPHNRVLPEVDCGSCHTEQRDALATGSHARNGNGERRKPRCLDCHGKPHEVLWTPRERTFAAAVESVNACLSCHDENLPDGTNVGRTYRENVHGQALFKIGLPLSATCVDCHGAHAVLPAEHVESPLNKKRVPDTCGRCHEGIHEVFAESVHGRLAIEGNGKVATCTSCHASHGVGKVTEAFVRGVVEECSHCHLDLGRTYLTSYHGKATALGHHSVAVCSSCHGAHDIQPRSDPRSRVHPERIAETCGQCHDDVNENFVHFQTHADHRNPEKSAPVYYTWLVMTTLLVSVLLVFVPHSILWAIRETAARLKHPAALRLKHKRRSDERYVERFRPIHRWTHLLIIVSFTGLVATGFPLKYSYTDWAKGLSARLGGAESMAVLHRVFAVMTFAYAAIHLGYLVWFFLRRCPRPRLAYLFGPNSLILSMRDLKQFFQMVRWFLFLGPKPRFDRWMYLEKFDYWGEIWGVIVIGGSGLILWFPGFFTQWLPGWVINCALVVHSIEALLAASVIFIVHFLNTHLRPDKFPVDMVMFTGRMSESEMKEERPEEYERLVATGELESRIVSPVSARLRMFGYVAGILAFLCGLTLIVLAMLTELAGLA